MMILVMMHHDDAIEQILRSCGRREFLLIKVGVNRRAFAIIHRHRHFEESPRPCWPLPRFDALLQEQHVHHSKCNL